MIPRSVELNGKCPYCEYAWAVELIDVRGRDFAERCTDCGELFVVEACVAITATVHAIEGVDRNDVLDRLLGAQVRREVVAPKPVKPTVEEPPKRQAAPEWSSSAADDESETCADSQVAPGDVDEELAMLLSPKGDPAIVMYERKPPKLTVGKPAAAEPLEDDEPEPEPPPAVHPRTSDGRRTKISYDDRTRIRVACQAALEQQQAKGLTGFPRGFVKGLAAEYDVSEVTIYSISKNRDSF